MRGYELDWVAKSLGGCSIWVVRHIPSHDPVNTIPSRFQIGDSTPEADAIDRVPSIDPVHPGSPSLGVGVEESLLIPVTGENSDATTPPLDPRTKSVPEIVMEIRTSLAGLSDDWVLSSRKTVEVLLQAIEGTIRSVFANMDIKQEYQDSMLFEWRVPVAVQQNQTVGTGELQEHEVSLRLTRERDETGSFGDWSITSSELEAIFCLWVSSLAEFDRMQAQRGIPRPKHIRLLRPAPFASEIDYELWIQRTMKPQRSTGDAANERYFGWCGDVSNCDVRVEIGRSLEYICVETDRELEPLCAQSLYTLFLGSLASWVADVGGTTTQRKSHSNTRSAERENAWEYSHLSNSNFTSIANIFVESNLGTIEEAYQCIIPTFCTVKKPRYPDDIYSVAMNTSKALSKHQSWKPAAEINSWLYQNSWRTNAPTSVIDQLFAQHLAGLCKTLLSGTEGANSDIWDLIDTECRMLTGGYSDEKPGGYSHSNKVFAMVTRAMTYLKSSNSASKEVFFHLLQAAICSMAMENIVTERSTMTAAWDKGVFNDPESFAEFLFVNNTGRLGGARGIGIRALMRFRGSSGTAFSGTKFEARLSDKAMLNKMATSTAEKHEQLDLTNSTIDILISCAHQSPVQYAASLGRRDVLEKLANAGADLNQGPEGPDGRSPLQAAAENGHKDLVVWLIKRGVALTGAPAASYGLTALQAAAANGNRELVELLLGGGVNSSPAKVGGRTALQAAAERGHGQVVRFLLHSGADINAAPAKHHGRTALQAAAGQGHIEMVTQLLDAGASPNEPAGQDRGRTALQAAAEGGHNQMVVFLLNRGVGVDGILGDSLETALQAAAGAGHSEVVRQLLRAGADVNAPAAFSTGHTALQAAVRGGHRNIIEILLLSNADIHAAPGYGFGVSVMEAILKNPNPQIRKMIVRAESFDIEAVLYSALIHGTDGLFQDILQMDDIDWNRRIGAHEETALHRAIRHGHTTILKELLNIPGVDRNCPDGHGCSPLIAAICAANRYATDFLVGDPGVLVNHPDSQQSTALSVAASSGDTYTAKRLLSRPDVDVNRVSTRGCTPLHLAAIGGHAPVIRELLQRVGVQLTLANHSGAQALHLASQSGLEQAVARLLSNYSMDINRRDGDGATPLLLAAAKGHGLVVRRLLVRSDIEVNTPDRNGQTPLVAAVRGGHRNAVEQLLANGADVNTKCLDDQTALHVAATCSCSAIVAMLLDIEGVDAEGKTNKGWTPLMITTHAGDHQSVELLIPKSADVNHQTDSGITSLTLAVESGKHQIVEALLKAPGIDVNLRGEGGLSPLHHAAQQGHLSIVELLLKEDVRTNAVSGTKSTALMYAAQFGNEMIVRKLLERPDIDVRPEAKHGRTAFSEAVRSGQPLLVMPFLNRSDIDVNCRSGHGCTALGDAASRGFLSIVNALLLLQGADVNQLSENDQSPITHAAYHGRDAVVERLLQVPTLDVNRGGEGRSTALYLAAQNGHLRVVQLLLSRYSADLAATKYAGCTPFTPTSLKYCRHT